MKSRTLEGPARHARRNIDPWYATERGYTSSPGDDLVYLSVALNGECNLDCTFCYVDGSRPGSWNPDELFGVLDDARASGLRKVQLTGGEPTLYPHLTAVLEYLHKHHIETLLVSNGTTMTPRLATALAKHEVIVGISLESINHTVDDALTRRRGGLARKLRTISELKAVGYTEKLPLNIIIKTLAANEATFMETWHWALANGIQPILDRAIPGPRLPISDIIRPERLRLLLDEIGEAQGVPHRIPFVGNEGCDRLECGVHIETNGDVLPCGGLKLALGNVHDASLSHLWATSAELRECRTCRSNLRGSCGLCSEKDACMGCRAVAFEVFGDLHAPDPLCWRYKPADGYPVAFIDDGVQCGLRGPNGEALLPQFLARLQGSAVPPYVSKLGLDAVLPYHVASCEGASRERLTNQRLKPEEVA